MIRTDYGYSSAPNRLCNTHIIIIKYNNYRLCISSYAHILISDKYLNIFEKFDISELVFNVHIIYYRIL